MFKYLLIFTLVFSSSCMNETELALKNGIHYVPNVSTEIERAYIVPWKVGLKREAEVSMGVRFFSTIPMLSDDAEDTLINKYGIDSWVIRFTRVRRNKHFRMRYFFIKFKNITRNTKNISVSLFYQAAAVSKKFRFFHCPAFDHRYEVRSFQLEERSGRKSSDIFVRSIEKLNAKVTRFKFSPMVLPAGRSLKGDYYVDYALFDSQRKQRYSNWHAVDKVLSIQQELSKIVASCAGIKEEYEPLPQSRVPDITDFEIK